MFFLFLRFFFNLLIELKVIKIRTKLKNKQNTHSNTTYAYFNNLKKISLKFHFIEA